MRFRKILEVAIIAASALLLASCGSSSAKSSQSSSKTITFWYGGDAATAVKPVVKDFEKKTGIKVKVQSVPWSSYNDKLLTAAASKTGPDALVVGTTEVANYASSQTLMDLTNEVKKDSSISNNQFFKGSVDTTKVHNKQYALPWYVETRVLYYRKDLLKSVGYDSAPKTWSQLYDAALKLSKRGKNMYGFNVDSAEPTFGFMFARQNGATLIKNGKAQFNKAPMVDALKYLDKFVKNGAAPAQDTKLTIGQSFGSKGPIPMFISGPWMIQSIQKTAGLKDSQWGVAELPKGPVNNMSITGGGDLAVFNYSKHKKEALEFVKFLNSKKEQIKYFKASNSMPTRKSAWTDNSLSDSKIQTFRKQLNASEPMPALKAWDTIGTNYTKAWQQITISHADIQKTMDSFNKQSQQLMDK